MIAYILMELFRLLIVTAVLITWLLVLKQNTMDIGLLIGASVLVSFGLCKYDFAIFHVHRYLETEAFSRGILNK